MSHQFPTEVKIFKEGGVMSDLVLNSYISQTLSQWKTELHNRVIPESMTFVRNCKPMHGVDATDYDLENWKKVEELRTYLGRTSLEEKCLMTRVNEAVDNGDLKEASRLQKELQVKLAELTKLYVKYKRNLF